MKKVYLEPSAINEAQRRFFGGQDLRGLLAKRGFSPATGIHTVYELGRAFLNSENTELAKQLFRILYDLDPSYQPTVADLLGQEIVSLRTGAAVLPFLDHLNQVATHEEVLRLSQGLVSDRALQFIQAREADIRHNHPLHARFHMDQGALTRRLKTPKVKSFEDLVAMMENALPELIFQVLKRRVSRSEAKELSQRLDSFPTLRTTVRANLYLSFIAFVHVTQPAFDKLDDYRHVIEASYCDALITCDGQLNNTAPKLHPGLLRIHFDDMVQEVTIGAV